MNGNINRNHSTPVNGRDLFDAIGRVSFAMDELRLYLDTHPNCAEALSLFTEYMTLRQELVGRYTRTFGPLDSYCLDTENGWRWTDEPMPWKTEVNSSCGAMKNDCNSR